MLQYILPQETRFFDCFEISSRFAVESARCLDSVIRSGEDTSTIIQLIAQYEEKADTVKHQALDLLHNRFVVPFERRTIQRLADELDEVVDLINAAAQRINLYQLNHSDLSWLAGLSDAVVEAVEHVERALQRLADRKSQRDEILIHCVRINEIENQADEILRETQAAIFRSVNDTKVLLQLRELCDLLEAVTDCCEDVAQVVEGIVLDFH